MKARLAIETLLEGLRSVRVHFANGQTIETSINGSNDDIEDYYVGKVFNIGSGEEDKLVKAVKVEFLDGED